MTLLIRNSIVLLLFFGLARPFEVSSKVGLAWSGSQSQVSQFLQTGKVSWYYHWSETPDIRENLDFAPMLWGSRDAEGWQETIGDTIDEYNVSTLLGMNEPNLSSQSDLTPQEAAILWKQYIQPYKTRGLRLASPVPTNAPTGPTWLQDFLGACGSDCTVDIIALHYYGTNATMLIDYVKDVYNIFHLPIWLTEFACQSFVDANDVATAEEVSQFMNITVSFLESTPWVERYSWFGAATTLPGMNPLNALMDPNGHINDLGLQYIGAGTFVQPNTTDSPEPSPVPTFVPKDRKSVV